MLRTPRTEAMQMKKKERAMKTLITVAALALGLAAPALAQDAKPAPTPSMAPAAKPAEAPKATPATTKDAAKPGTNPADAKTGDKPVTGNDAKKVDPKAAAPAAPTGKVVAPKTTEKPAETKKQ
jgi:hypothetical protein